MPELDLPPIVDLGLSLDEAKQGLRVSTAYESKMPGEVDRENGPIIPIEVLKSQAFYKLMLDKGVFTEAEYEEALRVIYNSELAQREEVYGEEFR